MRPADVGLALTIEEQCARLRADLRMGVGIVLRSDDGFALVLAVETLSADRLEAARALGEAVLAITNRRADTLKARAYDGDLARIILPTDADLVWVKAVADPSDDLRVPMKGPLQSVRDGDAAAHRAALELCKTSRLLPAAVVVAIDQSVAEQFDLNSIAISDIPTVSSKLHEVARANLPLAVSENARLHIFRPEDGGEEHYAIEIGRVSRDEPALTRLHSACFTGDLIGSLKCDCGPQLRAALQQIGKAGSGVLLYLNQEGRGIGLANKMRAYSLQNQGFDTVEANHRLGFEDDERDFLIGAEMLKSLGLARINLLTNNPRKVEMMEAAGLDVVERVPLIVGKNKHNESYLETKAARSGHLL